MQVMSTHFLEGQMKKKKAVVVPPPTPAPRAAPAPKQAPAPKPAASNPKQLKPPAPQSHAPIRVAPALSLEQQQRLRDQALKARLGIGGGGGSDATSSSGTSAIPGAEFVAHKPRRAAKKKTAAAAVGSGGAGAGGSSSNSPSGAAQAGGSTSGASARPPWLVEEEEEDPRAHVWARMPKYVPGLFPALGLHVMYVCICEAGRQDYLWATEGMCTGTVCMQQQQQPHSYVSDSMFMGSVIAVLSSCMHACSAVCACNLSANRGRRQSTPALCTSSACTFSVGPPNTQYYAWQGVDPVHLLLHVP